MNDNDNSAKLDALLGFVESDPDNQFLLADAAQAALDCREDEMAAQLVARLVDLAPDAFSTIYCGAMLAMRSRDFAYAADGFARLMQSDDSPALRFNRSWSLAMIGDKDSAAQLLDDATVAALPAAAMLRLQLMHEAGDFNGAVDFAKAMLPTHGENAGFAAAVSVLALDVEDLELARECAVRGGRHPDALATCAMLALWESNPEGAMADFDAAIAIRQHHPRAWIGRGLARLARHDSEGAAADLDHGAAQFGDHIGSWLAAGWAHFTAGHNDESRERFERALRIDDNFAESHGSLAVLDAIAGDSKAARRRVAIAMRLDRQCFSATLATTLLMHDDPESARMIVEQALTAPINKSGQTIAGYMAAMRPPTLH
ncbi:MAG: hypothetical protein AABZ45_02445 [Pseudomonadota bacterium]